MDYQVIKKRVIAAAASALEGRPLLAMTAKPTSSGPSVVHASRSLASNGDGVLPRVSTEVILKSAKCSVREDVELSSREAASRTVGRPVR